jgi:hypothetical protein
MKYSDRCDKAYRVLPCLQDLSDPPCVVRVFDRVDLLVSLYEILMPAFLEQKAVHNR